MASKILIKAVESKIQTVKGENVVGKITIRPSESFELLQGGTPAKVKVSVDPVVVDVASGTFTSFYLWTLTGSSQDKTGLYYVVDYQTQSGDFTEYWTLSATDPDQIEIIDVPRIVPLRSVTEPVILASEVSILSAANKIPRAGANGKIDPSFFEATDFVIFFEEKPAQNPASNQIAFAREMFEGGQFQIVKWDGQQWSAL